MNALGFVFSILMILSFGFSICVGKQLSDQRLRLTYRGHSHANRLILAQCERALYRSLPQKPSPSKPKKAVASQKKSMKTPNPKINPKCAQINLAPLLEKGREDEPLLYDTTAKLLKLFYGKALFENKPHAEFHFLKVFVEAMKATKAKQKFFALEKVQFKDPSFQLLYYKMLKGMKDPENPYPSLLDYIKVEPSTSLICLFHADPQILSILFGSKASAKIYETIHVSPSPLLTKELIHRLCSEAHAPIYNTDIFDLIDFSRSKHKKEFQKRLVGEDPETHISLRKTVLL